MRDLPQGMGSAFAYHSCEDVAEPIDPETDALMGNINTALVEQIFDIAKGKREPDVHHHRDLDDLAQCFDVAEGRYGHRETVG